MSVQENYDSLDFVGLFITELAFMGRLVTCYFCSADLNLKLEKTIDLSGFLVVL